MSGFRGTQCSRDALKAAPVFYAKGDDSLGIGLVRMEGRENTVRVLVQGLDWQQTNHRKAFFSYLERNNISFCRTPAVTQDGSISIQLGSNERLLASDSAALLTSPAHHIIEGIMVSFFLDQESATNSRSFSLPSQQQSERSTAKPMGRGIGKGVGRGVGVGHGGGFGRGRGRGMWSQTQIETSGARSMIPPVLHGSTGTRSISSTRSLPGHAVRLQYSRDNSFSNKFEERHWDTTPLFSSMPWSQSDNAPALRSGVENTATFSLNSSELGLHYGQCEGRQYRELAATAQFQGSFETPRPTRTLEDSSTTDAFVIDPTLPTEGLNVISIQSLPQNATRQGLTDAIHLAIKSVKSDVSCEVKVVQWSNGSARAHLSNLKAVVALWRIKHKPTPSIVYDGHALSWDLAVPEKYEEDKILVEGLPLEMTAHNLEAHVKDNDCISEEVKITVVIQDDKSKAVIVFDDDIADSALVEYLNEHSSFYEGRGKNDIQLAYSLIPISRYLILRELDTTVSRGSLRNYFNSLPLAGMSRPALIEKIEALDDESAVVKLRTAEGCKAVLSMSVMPPIGQENKRPSVETFSEHRYSDVHSTIIGNKPTAPTVEVAETETVNISVEGDDAIVTNFIWNSNKYRKRLTSHLDCKDCYFDQSTLSLSKAACISDKLQTKFEEFVDNFTCKKILIMEKSLWQRAMKFVKNELTARSGEVEMTDDEEKLEILFVGPKGDVLPIHQLCADRFSAWRNELEEANANVEATVALPSLYHARILERSPLSKPEAINIDIKYSGNKASVFLQGPRNVVTKFRDEMLEVIESIVELQVPIDQRIVKFLTSTGLSQLNARLKDSQIVAMAMHVDTNVVQFIALPEETTSASTLIKNAYACQPIRGVENDEMQQFIRSEEYNQFVASIILNEAVMIDPCYDDIKESDSPVTLTVVGETSAVQTSSEIIEDFLVNNVVFTAQVELEHAGFVKYLNLFKSDDLNELKRQVSDFKPEIDLTTEEDIIIVKSTKSGLEKLKDGVERLVSAIKFDEFEVKQHGLLRFLRSSVFQQQRYQIEKKHSAILWIDGEDDEELAPGNSIVRSDLGIPKQLVEYRVPNSTKAMVLYVGDLCSHKADAIVNAANETLDHVGGLAKVIVDRAGRLVQDQCKSYIREHSTLPTGNAMWTEPGRLTTTKNIIHTVGPRWPYSVRDTVAMKRVKKQLQKAVTSSLELATNLKCKTIAFPAISTGVFGCSSEFVAKNIVQSVIDYVRDATSTTITQVHVVLLETDTENVRCFKECMKANLNPIARVAARENPDTVRVPQTSYTSETSRTKKHVQTPRSFSGPFQVYIKAGDITNEKSDAIVNSTNGDMNMKSALASKTVSEKAGPGLQIECASYVSDNGPLSPGDIYTSGGHKLSCQHVIHVNCPNNPKGLSRALEDCLNEANRVDATSVSLPALATGRMGMPDDAAAKAMFDGIERFMAGKPSSVRQVNIVIFDKPRIPVFAKEKMRREGEESEGDVEAETLSVGGVSFSNGTVLSVESGDVTSDTSDVIVAPTGVVYSAVARKSPETNAELSTRYRGGPNPVADLAAGGQLSCRRVYAISVPSRSANANDGECIQTIQTVIMQCLSLANCSGYSSIAIPAIGTGGLGYHNKHTAAAVIEACKAFATITPTSKLQSVKISVFDTHRLNDFQTELLQRSPQKSKSLFQKVASGFRALGNWFSSGSEPPKPKRTRKPMKSFAAGDVDFLTLTVFADSRSTCKTVQTEVQDTVVRFCINKEEDIKIPQGFDESELKEFAAESGVALKFNVQDANEGTATLTLSGFTDDVKEVQGDVLRRLNKAFMDETETVKKEKILETIRWSWQDDDGSFKEYTPEVTVKLEKALETGENVVKINVGSIQYEVNTSSMVQGEYGRKSRTVKREWRNQESSGEVPSHWVDPGSRGHDYKVHAHKLKPTDPEYRKVSQAFTGTNGGGRITSIERIQNPKLYRSYLQEKDHIAKIRKTELQSKVAILEVMGFHGTNVQAIDQIITTGFNRSYAGKAAGTAFGKGVYFASTAQYSSRYAPAGLNGERKMLYCDVLLGMFTVGNSSMLEPPLINPGVSNTDKYDSTVNNQASPSVYVSCYRDNMAYPTYLITFM